MKKSKVAILGYGYVGKAYHKVFPDAYIYDYHAKDLKAEYERVNECDLAIICVPTPTSDDGLSCDTSIVEEILEWLETPLILIKSTVKPGTTEKLQADYPNKNIVFSPEYVGEGGYMIDHWKYPHPTDPRYHDFMILGGNHNVTTEIISIFVQKVGPRVQFMQTNSRTAEVIKYMENFFYATKIIFVNEMFEACKALGVDFNEVREGWLLDKRVDRNHSTVFKDKRGYEGKCLPKDTKAFVASVKEAGYRAKFLESVIENNARIREINGEEPV